MMLNKFPLHLSINHSHSKVKFSEYSMLYNTVQFLNSGSLYQCGYVAIVVFPLLAGKWDISDLKLMCVHQAVFLCALSLNGSSLDPSARWNNFTCSTASGVNSSQIHYNYNMESCRYQSVSQLPSFTRKSLSRLWTTSLQYKERCRPIYTHAKPLASDKGLLSTV